MRGIAQCRLVGGPANGEVIELAASQCLDRLAIEQECRLEARDDGGADVMRGTRPHDANWQAYSLAVYAKDPLAAAGGVTFRFQEIQTVTRCGAIVALENRRCKHQALDGQRFCRQHQKN